jgi:hypothetical protein
MRILFRNLDYKPGRAFLGIILAAHGENSPIARIPGSNIYQQAALK